MNRLRLILVALSVSILPASYLVLAQQPAQGRQGGRAGGAAPMPMSFFVTSIGKGDGANLGGLAGADAHCQALAAAAGRGAATWRAYLSTQGPGAVNARDRIGTGPWYNARGQVVAMNVSHLHGDTLDEARAGNGLGRYNSATEKQTVVSGVGDATNQHDALTGSTIEGRAYTDGMDHTCSNWTSNATGMGSAQLGHIDRQGRGANNSWNSSHGSRGCSQADLIATGGAGLFYCFAVN
jgi:hypothetical protein